MRLFGIVTESINRTATVEVKRMSACSGCHRANPGMESVQGEVANFVKYLQIAFSS